MTECNKCRVCVFFQIVKADGLPDEVNNDFIIAQRKLCYSFFLCLPGNMNVQWCSVKGKPGVVFPFSS